MTEEELIQAVKQVKGIQGMTVNERLFASGLMSEFDQAKKNDKGKAIRVLELLQVDKFSIDKIIR